MTDTIDGEIVEERGLTTTAKPAWQAGTLAIAALSEEEFNARLLAMKQGQARVARIQRELLDEGVDYGTIPGTPRPTLLKPGAEKLCVVYQLVGEMLPTVTYGDGVSSPAITYRTQCLLHLGDTTGPVVADGWGVANSWEKKYRYRGKKADLLCPDCGKPGLRFTKRDVWWHPMDAAPEGGCNGNFRKDDPAVTSQPRGTEVIENPDPFDVEVTLLKISEKRAFVDSTLRATATSGLFTQDEDQIEAQAAREYGAVAEAPVPERAPVSRPAVVKCQASGVIGPEPCTKDKGHAGPHDSVDGVWPAS